MALEPVSFADLITCTRASSATRVNASGLNETASTNVARIDYDPVTLVCKGLLIEEARTNLLLRSQEFDNVVWNKTNITVTADAAVAVDGTTTADKLDEGAATGVHSVLQSFTSVSGTAYAATFYLQNGDARYAQIFFGSAGHGSTAYANFDLQAGTVGTVGATATASITNMGNGIYRCGIVATATASSAGASAQLGIITASNSARALSYAGANKFIYAWGAQVEAGSFATSYIPTTSATVTRAADVASMTGTNFSSWFNATEGTFVAEVLTGPGTQSGTQGVFGLDDGTTANVLLVGQSNAPLWRLNSRVSSSIDVDIQAGAAAANTTYKVAAAYKANDYALASSGAIRGTDTANTVPTVDRLKIGNHVFTTPFNGHIRRLSYFPQRLSNAQLQALTT